MSSATGVQTTVAAGTTPEATAQEGLGTTSAALSEIRQTLQTLTHELRQPLSAIESTAYYLSLVLDRGDLHAREHASRLRNLVEQTNWILSCAQQLSDTTPLAQQSVDLNELLTELGSLRRLDGLRIRFDLIDDLPLVCLDLRRSRVMIGSLMDLLGRVDHSGREIYVQTQLPTSGRGAALEMKVSIPGLHSESGLGCGAQLCLDAARRTVEAHGGEFECITHPATGILLRMVLQ